MPALLRKLVIFAAVDGLILQPQGYGQGQQQQQQRRGNSPSEDGDGDGDGNGNTSAPASTSPPPLPPPVLIEYQTHRISDLPAAASNRGVVGCESLEASGIVGLLSVASYSFLISITQRQQVAQILSKPIYAITNVAVIPLSSQAEASKAIVQARRSTGNRTERDTAQAGTGDDSDSSDVETLRTSVEGTGAGGGNVASDDHEIDDNLGPETSPEPERESLPVRSGKERSSSIAEDVIGRKGRYGRFASHWFSKKGWRAEKRSTQGMSSTEPSEVASLAPITAAAATTATSFDDGSGGGSAVPYTSGLCPEKEKDIDEQTSKLLPKLLRYTKMFFGGRHFYMSYDYDITRRFGVEDIGKSYLPLHRVMDPLFFWNRNLMQPFIESGHHHLVLPVMQGFIGQREFAVEATKKAPDERPGQIVEARITGEAQNDPSSQSEVEKHNFLLTLISRRSIKRPGVRYLRRGVDDEGNTANTVETEQILSTPSWDRSRRVYSFLQLRGSIPLYFSQSPYYLKPIPVMHHSGETNRIAFNRHFHTIARRYGQIQAVCLVDQHGGEVKIGEAYENFAEALNKSGEMNGSQLGFEWFDFHTECRGMKFENVKKLVTALEDTQKGHGETIVQDNVLLKKQTGIIRTNCMDCLDRTSVQQCAFGQRALEHELELEGIDINLQSDISTQWFNTLWADNGDAISKQYSSTAALKGDYTRTRKRDYRGALNDFGLTLSRYYNNLVNDYFAQTCIDYLLGNVTTLAFKEFEIDLMSADPGISVEKMRQSAIDASCKIVISDESEELVGGWTMLSPMRPNTLRSLPLVESVLLLTDAALYSCRFDWNTDKVTSFEKIDLRSITSISYGTYITSTLADTHMDEKRNVGMVVAYRPGEESIMRVNTRSLQSLFQKRGDQGPTESGSGNSSSNSAPEWDLYSWFKGSKQSNPQFMAFKALSNSNSATTQARSIAHNVSEIDAVRAICEDIERTAMAGHGRGHGHVQNHSIIEERDIISLEDARKRTGLLEHLVFDIKKMVWA